MIGQCLTYFLYYLPDDLNPRSVESPLQQSSSSVPPSGSVPHQKPPSSSSSSSSSTPSSSSSHQTEASSEDTKSSKAKSKTPYIHAAITNNVDNKIRRELDEADELRGQVSAHYPGIPDSAANWFQPFGLIPGPQNSEIWWPKSIFGLISGPLKSKTWRPREFQVFSPQYMLAMSYFPVIRSLKLKSYFN